jgi:hypothetical protein
MNTPTLPHLVTNFLRGLLTALLCTLPACVGSQWSDARQGISVPSLTLANGAKPIRLHLQTSYQFTSSNTTLDYRQSRVDYLNSRLEDLMSHDGSIEMHHDVGTADYRLVTRVRDDNHFNQGSRQLVAYTLWLWPWWGHSNYTTDIELIDARGNLVGKKRLKHSYSETQQLFLLVAAPFAPTGSAYTAMWQHVLTDASAWAVESIQASRVAAAE